MKLKILGVAYHRNGVAGAGFDVVLFKVLRERGTKVAILFDAPGHCAVLDVSLLAAGDIAFGSNSWRGDEYERALRRATEVLQNHPAPTIIEHAAKKLDTALRTYGDPNSLPENLIDLLTDARHWCDHSGEDFAKLDSQSYEHHLAEINDAKETKQ